MQIESKYDLSTPQGVFDHVADAIIAQGKPAYLNGGCYYALSHDTSCRCAAGHLMTADGVVLAKLTGTLVHPRNQAFLDERITEEGRTVARQLQDCHDGAAIKGRSSYQPAGRKIDEDERNIVFMVEFMERMRDLAKKLKLSDARVTL